MHFFFLFSCFFFISCATKKFNQALIKEWSLDSYKVLRYQPFPKSIIFETKDIQLLYIATRHADWKGSQSSISNAIKIFKPTLILIEGLHRSWGESPMQWKEKLGSDFNQYGNESYFAFKMALEDQIPFMGSEPGRMSEYSSLERDKKLLELIFEVSKVHRKILVVYGAGHYVQQEAALIDYFSVHPKLISRPPAQ